MTTTQAVGNRATSRAERYSYAAYFAGQNIVYNLIQLYLAAFAVTALQLDPVLVTLMILAVRVWDAFNDPLIGTVMDRFRVAGTRYKFWLNLTTFMVPIATFALFLAPTDASQGVKIAYFIISYLIWDVLYTFSEVPIFAISTSMSTHEGERTWLLTLTQIGSVLGVVFSTLVIDQLVADGVDALNWVLLGAIPSAMAVAAMIPQIFLVRERYHTDVVEEASLGQMFREVLRNDQHFIAMSLYLAQAFLNASSVFVLYVGEGFYGDAQLATRTALFSLLGIIGLGIATPTIVRMIGKRRYMEYSMLATILLSLPVFFIPADQTLLAIIFLGLRITTLVVTSLLRPMFTADCIEYGEQKTGIRNDATAFAIQTFFNKTGDALGQALGTAILALVLFDETLPIAQQSPDTINALQNWYIILPMLMAAVFYIGFKFFYKLDEEQVKQMIEANRKWDAALEPAAD